MSTQTSIAVAETKTEQPDKAAGTESDEPQDGDLLVFGTGENAATLNLRTGELKCRVGTIEGN